MAVPSGNNLTEVLGPGDDEVQRLLATCPRPVNEEDIARIFARSIENW